VVKRHGLNYYSSKYDSVVGFVAFFKKGNFYIDGLLRKDVAAWS
jgi:hypothetical protein